MKHKTKEGLIEEVTKLRQQIAKLEESESQNKQAIEQVRKNGRQFRSIFNAAFNLIIFLNSEGIITNCNKRIESVLGYEQEEIMGQPIEKLIHTFSREEARHCLEDISKKEHSSKEIQMIRKDGRLVDVIVNSSTLRDEEDNCVGTICIIDDITDLKQSMEALRASKEKLRKLFESLTDGIFVLNLNGVYTEINKRMIEIHGLKSRDDMLGKNSFSFIASKDLDRARNSMQEILKQGVTTYREFKARKADGTEFPAEVSGAVIKNVSGNPTGFIGIIRDISDRKQAEEKIRASEEKFRNIFENVHDGMIFLDNNGTILEVNKKAIHIYGGSKKEVLGKHFTKLDVFSLKDLPMLMRKFKNAFSGEIPAIHLSIKNKRGQEIYLECSAAPIRKDEQTAGIIVIAHDITERINTEEKLKESEERYKNIIELAPDAILILNLKGTITFCNTAFTNLTGYSQKETVNRHFSRLPGLPKEDISRYIKIFKPLLRGKIPKPFESAWIHKDESTRWGETRIDPIKKGRKTIGFQIIGRDITERKKAEKQP
ncbi:MAG: PAS domain-containing protein [Candidatus Aminicenantes bacterium]|nr:MAG: PAS domain-containing protein [Candidatus Aminicenantes bacterium]